MTRQWAKLEREKSHLVGDLSNWTAEQLQTRPSENEWSALDVLKHLCLVERAFVRVAKSGVPEEARVTMANRVRARVVNAVMRSPMRVKVPSTVSKMTAPQRVATTLEEAMGEWDSVHAELQDILLKLEAKNSDRPMFQHPVSGWLTADLGVAFLAAHCRHHRYQLDRLKRDFRSA